MFRPVVVYHISKRKNQDLVPRPINLHVFFYIVLFSFEEGVSIPQHAFSSSVRGEVFL